MLQSSRSGPPALLRRLLLLTALVALVAGCHPDAGAALPAQQDASDAQVDPVDQATLTSALTTLAPQRPGVTDLYVVGFAGDASDDVFRNETLYLKQLFEQRFDARGRVITLVNHPDNLGERPYAPLATYDNLYDTLAAIGKRMDRKEDALLLFVTTHGTEDHTLYVQVDQNEEDFISPQDLRKALDDAGIGNRVIVLSACYSGGFIPALRSATTLVLTAARADRPSFGCGNTSNATYFRPGLVDRCDEPGGGPSGGVRCSQGGDHCTRKGGRRAAVIAAAVGRQGYRGRAGALACRVPAGAGAGISVSAGHCRSRG